MLYSEKLRDPRWQKRRLEIFNRDGWKCKKCGSETMELMVHHKKYVNGFEPWDYVDDDLITLCVSCHENEHGVLDSKTIYHCFDKWMSTIPQDPLEYGPGFVHGIRTGYESFDIASKGFQKGDLILFASSPGIGKTEFIMNTIVNNKWYKNGILYFSLRLTYTKFMEKLFSIFSKCNQSNITTCNFVENYEEFVKTLNSNIFIDCDYNLDFSNIKRRMRQFILKNNVNFVVIDSLNQVSVNQKEYKYMCLELKRMAKELNIPIILFYNIGKTNYERADKRPNIADMPDVIDFFDEIIFLHYRRFFDKDIYKSMSPFELIFFKNSSGFTGVINLNYNENTHIFSEVEKS